MILAGVADAHQAEEVLALFYRVHKNTFKLDIRCGVA